MIYYAQYRNCMLEFHFQTNIYQQRNITWLNSNIFRVASTLKIFICYFYCNLFKFIHGLSFQGCGYVVNACFIMQILHRSLLNWIVRGSVYITLKKQSLTFSEQEYAEKFKFIVKEFAIETFKHILRTAKVKRGILIKALRKACKVFKFSIKLLSRQSLKLMIRCQQIFSYYFNKVWVYDPTLI